MMAYLTRRQKFSNGGDVILPKPNPLSQQERNQAVFNDYVGRMKKYLGAGVDMPEWFVKDLIFKKADELGIELKADGGRIGFKYGGTWADWKVNYEDQMTFEEYLQNDSIVKEVQAIEKRAGGGQVIGKPGGLVEPGVMYYGKKVKKDTYSTFADMSVEKLRELGFTGKKYRKVGPPGKRYSLLTEEFKTWIKEQTPKAKTWRKGQGVSEKQLKKASKAKLTKTKVNQILKANSELKNGLRVFKLPLAIVDYNTTPNSVFAKVVESLDKDKVQIEGLKKVFKQAIKDGNYLTKDAYRKEMIVKAFMDDFAKHGQFTGEAKFNPILQEFKGKIPENAFSEINKTFKEWTKGKYEVEGFNRSTLDKHTTKNLKNWKPVKNVTELRLQVDDELRFLNDLNINEPNLSVEQVKKRFNQKFKTRPYWLETSFENRALQLYPHKIYGEGRFRIVEGVEIGERSPWLKKVYKNNLSGNFSRILAAADSFEDAGNMQMAKKYRKAAKDLFGSKGIITKVGGQAEHPWFYNYGKGLFQIDSLVKGDINNFKAKNFEIPIRNLIIEYESKTKPPTLARKKAIEAEVKLRRDFINQLTDIGDGGMARNVNFDFTAETGKKITNTTPDIYQLHTTGKLDPLELQARGTAYRTALINNLTKGDLNIKKTISAPMIKNFLKKMGRTAVKQVPLVGATWGAVDAAETKKRGLTDPDELTVGYHAGPDIAQWWSDYKEKDRNDWASTPLLNPFKKDENEEVINEEVVTENKPTYGPYANQIKDIKIP
jgi:hypothetical protein